MHVWHVGRHGTRLSIGAKLPATRFTVRMRGPQEEHTLSVGKLQSWRVNRGC